MSCAPDTRNSITWVCPSAGAAQGGDIAHFSCFADEDAKKNAVRRVRSRYKPDGVRNRFHRLVEQPGTRPHARHAVSPSYSSTFTFVLRVKHNSGFLDQVSTRFLNLEYKRTLVEVKLNTFYIGSLPAFCKSAPSPKKQKFCAPGVEKAGSQTESVFSTFQYQLLLFF